MVPDRNGQPPKFVNTADKKDTPKPWPSTAPGPEVIQARLEVQPDGTISSLSMEWLQAGSLGWPYFVRVDADDIYLKASFGHGTRYESPFNAKPQTAFNPELVVMSLAAYSKSKFRRHTAIKLSHSQGYGFGGLAGIPYWGHSAEIVFGWPELRAFAGDQTMLNVSVTQLGRDPQELEQTIKMTWLDIRPIPVVIEQMQLAEQELRQMSAQAPSRCTKDFVSESENEPVI
ncbi:MAG: hypothetical protein ABL914_09680 [Novosphingobium sp.]|uniref:hypothetical protein n=1 Tax=Novosphingobium sp. TaxID=1874826 RepID=UPI0032BA8CEF